ncbi:LLM class flavin-dependent oxidoreductase [Nocardiopsis quinghaiensis]|uniref:LLM class flavin-dependent oxidoreductase n=1 Tax=Nocardiopsis quinghaiensis TaxID=464995 RepID=UPI00123C6300|nr:LLM class flavin-dependent oxidoreductase [Nocardiopsis quinghaiensis]
MEFGIACAFGSGSTGSLYDAIQTGARAAEELGFASWWALGDREVLTSSAHDPTLGLHCVARATRTIRLGLAGDLPSVRAAAVRAKQLASLDWFSDGRVELGIDVDEPPQGLLEDDGPADSVDSLGTAMDRLAAMEALWTRCRGEVRSDTVTFAGAIALPKTVGERRLPVHLRGTKALRRVLERRGHIDGWLAWRVNEGELRNGLGELADVLGADAAQVRKTWFVDAGETGASREGAAAAGVDELVAVFEHVPGADELRKVIA